MQTDCDVSGDREACVDPGLWGGWLLVSLVTSLSELWFISNL